MDALTCPMMPANAYDVLAQDKAAGWQLIREAGPVLRDGENTFYVTQREEVLAALRDPALPSGAGFDTQAGFRQFAQPHRRVLEQLFTPRASREVVAAVRELIGIRIDGAVAAGGCEAVGDVAWPMAGDLCKSMFRLTASDVADAETVGGLAQVITRRRANPGDDVLSRLLLHLDDDEALGLVLRLWQGVQSTCYQAVNALLELAVAPQLATTLREEPNLVPRFIEEVLRLSPVIPMASRTAVEEAHIAGKRVPAGSLVQLCVEAVNRDGSDAWSGDDVVLGGRGHPHVSFGGGLHRCRGAHLVRQSMRAFVEEWVARVARCELPAGYRPVLAHPDWTPHGLPLIFTA